jgi:general secretion pathway protein D
MTTTASRHATRPGRRRLATLLFLTAFVAGCATSRAFRDGQDAEQRERWDLAVLAYQKAYSQEPTNIEFKMAFERARLKAAQVHYERGRLHKSAGQLDLAALEFEEAAALDPTLDVAAQELKKAKADIEARNRDVAGLAPIEQAKAKARGRKATPPMLNPASDKVIDVSFPPDTNIKKIYQAICSAAGINVIYDPQLKDDRFTLDLRGMTFQKALEVAMRQAGHFYKVLDEKTIVVAQDTQPNRKEYEDLVIRTFFLSNGDMKDVLAMVRGVLDLRRVQQIPQLNAIVIRDTADKVAVAEKLIEVNDKAKSEVVVDVELLLIGRANVLELGTKLSSYSVSAGVVGSDGKPVTSLPYQQLINLGINDFNFTIPTVTFNFIKNNTDAQVLAKPQLRIAEGEKAQLIIGDRVPIPVTTINTQQAIGNTALIPITSFQYQDVGIKVEVEPRVHHNKEVTLKLLLEISNISGYVPQPNGPSQPQIGTRTITSTIRLKDGETNFLAGLIRRDSSRTVDTIPFVGDIPLIGPLLSNNRFDDKSTDIYMTLTPHIIRAPQITEEDLLPIWVGTENNVSFSGLNVRLESPQATGSPFEPLPGSGTHPVPAPPRPANVPLIQGTPPTDLFRRTPAPTPTPAPQVVPKGSSSLSAPASETAPTAALAVGVASEKAAAAVEAPPVPTLSLKAASADVAPGQATLVALVGDTGLSDVGTLELTVEWDPSVAEVTGIVPGPWHAASGAEEIRFDADRMPGRARLHFVRKPGTWGLPEGVLAQLAVKGRASGTALFRVSAGSSAARRGPVAPVVAIDAVNVGPKG